MSVEGFSIDNDVRLFRINWIFFLGLFQDIVAGDVDIVFLDLIKYLLIIRAQKTDAKGFGSFESLALVSSLEMI